jgi:hypothetical protein
VIALAGLLVLAFVPEFRRRLAPRSWLRVAAILVPAALVNAWSLLPAIAYSAHTMIATEIDYINRHYGISALPAPTTSCSSATGSRRNILMGVTASVLAILVCPTRAGSRWPRRFR